jgi:voltage-gated sodium channel
MIPLLKSIIEHRVFTTSITLLIVLNAVILGFETYPNVMKIYGTILHRIDVIILYVFIVELSLRFLAYGRRFWLDPWNWFDTLVVTIAFVPSSSGLSVLRTLRVLRILRLISIFPRLRQVVEGLIHAIPGIGAIAAILVIIFYVFAVMATKFYGAHYPQWFGSLHGSFFSLFQIMTLEGWADMVRTIMVTHPMSWIFFLVYILASTFTVLNLFIAVIVDAMQRQHEVYRREENLKYDNVNVEVSKI